MEGEPGGRSQWTHKSPLSQAGDAFGHKYTFTTMAGLMGTILQPKKETDQKEVSHLKAARHNAM